MNHTKRYLKWSARRYFVNDFGEIFNSENKQILPVLIDGEYYVELEWVLGKRNYLVAIVVMCAFNKIALYDYNLDQVEPLYVDGSSSNLAPCNLIYRFRNGPLEVEHLPGFYHIPLHSNYAISKEGVMISLVNNRRMSWNVTKSGGNKNQTGGYKYCRVINDEGVSKIIFLHRALCMVFKKYDRDLFSLVVNHKDGKPSNNSIDNLEWTTYALNNQHAYNLGLKTSSQRPVLMKNLDTSEVFRFKSVSECARYIGKTSSMIDYRIRKAESRLYEDKLIFKYADVPDWPVVNNEQKIWRSGKPSSMIARNVFTGKLIIFRGCKYGEQITGVKASTILKHVRLEENIPVRGYNFRYLKKDLKWPQHSERHLLVYKDHPVYPPDGVIVKNIEDNSEMFLTSSSAAANKFSLSKWAFLELVRSKRVYKGKYLFSMFNLRENLSPLSQ